MTQVAISALATTATSAHVNRRWCASPSSRIRLLAYLTGMSGTGAYLATVTCADLMPQPAGARPLGDAEPRPTFAHRFDCGNEQRLTSRLCQCAALTSVTPRLAAGGLSASAGRVSYRHRSTQARGLRAAVSISRLGSW
jgi:hypothetical protein